MPSEYEELGTIEIAVYDEQRGYVEQFREHRYVGPMDMWVRDLDLDEDIKIVVYIYVVNVERAIEGIPYGYWLLMSNPEFWKRIDCVGTGVLPKRNVDDSPN